MWRERSLRQKILIGYFILVAVIATVGAWSIYNVRELNQVLADITKENYISVLAAQNMIGAIERQDSGELLLLVGERQQGLAICETGHQEFLYWFSLEEQNITIPNEGELVRSIKINYSKYSQLRDALYSRDAIDEPGVARTLYLAEIQPLFSAIRADLQTVLAMNHQEFMAGNSRSSDTARQAVLSVTGVGGSAVIFGIIFAIALSRAVVQPIVHVTEAVKRIREGNLNETVSITSFDEMGELAREFNSMLLRLRAYEEALYGKLAVEQQKALAIVQAMADGIVLIEQNQRIVMLNPAAEKIIGLNSNDAVGKFATQVFHQPVMGNLLNQAGNSEKNFIERTVTIKVEGREHFYEIEAVPFQDGVEVTGYAVILKDVTYFKLMDKKKSEFLSGIAHEIRTPLTSITMGVGILNENSALKDNQGALELIAVIQEETLRLTTLVDELLELSRFESGRTELKIQQLEVATLLERIVASFQIQAKKAQVQLEISVAGDIPAVKWDADKVQSVISNLLANALRYTPVGGRISVKAAPATNTVLLSVTDTGPGIPIQLQNKIFDKFYQMEARPAGKVGLGLAICKAIVKRHSGKIWVDSSDGQGATFFVELPIQCRPDK